MIKFELGLLKWLCFLFVVLCFFCGCFFGFWIDNVVIIIIILCSVFKLLVVSIIFVRCGLIGKWFKFLFDLVSFVFLWCLVGLIVLSFLSSVKLLLILWLFGVCINGNCCILLSFKLSICKIIEVKLVCKILGLVNFGCELKFFLLYKWI